MSEHRAATQEERDNWAAEAREHDALAVAAREDAALKQLEAQKLRLELDGLARKERDELAKNVHHHVYVLDKPIEDATVKLCIQSLVAWSRQDPGCDITIEINSPGGSIIDGFALIDFIRGIRESGHKVTIVALGYAASMAGVILQAADTRVMGKHALMLIHEGSLGAIGDFGKVEDRLKLMKMMHAKILALFTDRSNLSAAQIRNRWERKDWWLTAEDALKHKFVDEIR